LSQPRNSLYDSLAEDYDLIIDWPERLKREGPLLRRLAEESGARTVLDVGGGTGHHARMFHSWGLEVTLADPSAATLDIVRASLPAEVRLEVRSLRDLGGIEPHDMVVCLGNTMPHVADHREFASAMASLWEVLRPGGVLVCHQINYTPMLADFDERRFMEPRGRGDKVLFRFHESEPDGHGLRFVIMRLTSRSGDYTTEYLWTHHTPLTSVDYRRELQRLGASEARLLGGWDESAFDEDASDALIVVARK
jgi:SAM-dependent methyltransferase